MKLSGFGVIYGSQMWDLRLVITTQWECVGKRSFKAQRRRLLVIKARCPGIAYHAPGVRRDLDFRLSSHISPTRMRGKASFVMKHSVLESSRSRRCSSWPGRSPLCTCRRWKGARGTD